MRYFLLLFHAGTDDIEDYGRISRLLTNKIICDVDQLGLSEDQHPELDLWLDSPGGDAHAAYKLVIALRARFKAFRVVIPDCAKSAATLVALGADDLYMADAAELGPLDAQVEHPDREGVWISALDVARSIEHLANLALDLTAKGGAQLIRITGLRRAEVLHKMLEFSATFMQPIVAKLDPSLVHRAADVLRIAERYGERLLGKGQLVRPGRVGAATTSRAQIARQLVTEYPSHDFAICPDEAKELGLVIKPLSEYPYALLVEKAFKRFSDSGWQPIIGVYREEHLTSSVGVEGSEEDRDEQAEAVVPAPPTTEGNHGNEDSQPG